MSENIETSGSESIVLSTNNKNDALTLRADLMKNFEKLWVYVYNYNNELFDVKVANNWGAKLEVKVIKEIEKFVSEKNFAQMSVTKKKSVKKEKAD